MSDKYGTGQDRQYCYPDSNVLINKLGVTSQDALDAAEIELTQARIDQYEPDFDDISLLRWEPIGRAEWLEANIAAYHCRLELLTALIESALISI